MKAPPDRTATNPELIESLDELASVADRWRKAREKGRTPTALKNALTSVAIEAAELAYTEQRFCRNCGQAFIVGKGYAKRSRRTCSDSCRVVMSQKKKRK